MILEKNGDTTMSSILRREMAPISDKSWKEIELQGSRILKGNLTARKLVDFQGPLGLEFAAVSLGRLRVDAASEASEVGWGVHKVLPLVEIRVPFSLPLWELDNVERGARDPDLGSMTDAARKAALFEETALFHGFPGAGIRGMLQDSTNPPVVLSPDRSRLTESVELALLAIQEREIGGPYALVLGTEPFKWLMAGEPDAYPLRNRISALVAGGIHWSPVLEGGAVLSRRGGDFEMTVGMDMSIGYKLHDAQEVELYFAESFAFRVLEPAASVELRMQKPS